MGIVLRQIDITTVEHKARDPKRRLVEIKVYTHVNTAKRYVSNGQRECARRVRQALKRLNRSAAA